MYFRGENTTSKLLRMHNSQTHIINAKSLNPCSSPWARDKQVYHADMPELSLVKQSLLFRVI